jgi:hypothetical protein
VLTVDQLESAALSLPRPGRRRILKTLLDSLEAEPGPDAEWIAEVRAWMLKTEREVDEEADRRFRAFQAGELSSVPAKEALAELRKHIEQRPKKE